LFGQNKRKSSRECLLQGGCSPNHLFFADNSLLFCRANFNEWGNLLKVLEVYEAASGQKLNADKTSIFFSRNTGANFKTLISSYVGVASFLCYKKYLVLPALVGRSKMKTFEGIQSWVRKMVDGWMKKFLSLAGKEILIKAIVQAIPTYSMSVFQLPKKLCSNLNSIMCRFWWGHSAGAKGMAWRSWGRLGVPKRKGSMGFRDLEIFNRKARVEIAKIPKVLGC